MRRVALLLGLLFAVPSGITRAQGEPAEPDVPLRLDDTLQLPDFLHLSLAHRLRYEHLDNQFRVGERERAAGVALRTLGLVELRLSPAVLGVELADSRLYPTVTGTPLDTGSINPLEPLQAYVGLDLAGVLIPDDRVALRVGRLTLDLGSRRLSARNGYRNTINAFTGVAFRWEGPSGHKVRLFGLMPIARRPDDRKGLEDHRVVLDRERPARSFWGAYYRSRPWFAGVELEAWLLALLETDTAGFATHNRRLYTPGVRALRDPEPGALDGQLELALQFGSVRASAATDDTRDLDHLAYFVHAEVGYTLDHPLRPRAVLQYDHASGDGDPNDGRSGRFDTLYGARRFDYGPTGLFGPLARTNLISPALRLELSPEGPFDALAGYRLAWLASARDAWTTAGLRDPSGGSGRFLGHQLEVRLRYHPWPGNVTLELGAASLVQGDFASSAPDHNGYGDPVYVYLQVATEV